MCGCTGARERVCRLVAMDHDPALAVLDDDEEEEAVAAAAAAKEPEGDGEMAVEEEEEEEEEHVVLVPPSLLFNLSGGLRPCRCAFGVGGWWWMDGTCVSNLYITH